MSHTTALAGRAHRGHALFSNGFRPFFLFSSAWSALAVPIWIAAMVLGDGLIGGVDGRAWHVHEMLFGFLPGVVAGFLLTAVPNWTGRLPVTGRGLAALFSLWAAGRFASFLPGPAGAVVDVAFPLAFAAVVWIEVLAGRNWKNAPVCLLTSLLALANVAFHLRAVAPAIGQAPERLALSAAALMIALIGGRIIPSFTTNWLKSRQAPRLPAATGRLDGAGMALAAFALAGWTVWPDVPATGALLVLAGAATLVRLSRWRGVSTLAEPLVWILHLGYAWLGLGLVLLGASTLWPGAVFRVAGVHALTAGAVGVMTLAVMTRASLGHTGRPRTADRATLAVYLAVNAAALLRTVAPFVGSLQLPLLELSAALWASAFAGFTIAYAPMLWRPRVGG